MEPIKLINSEYVFSLYPNLLTVDYPIADIDINQLIEIVKYGYVKDIIESLRKPIPKEVYNLIKKEKIPCVTLSGLFDYRDRDGLVRHSGLIQVDIDKVEEYENLFQKIIRDPYVYICFRSPGGNGIKIIVKINPSIETHKDQFRALEIYFKEQFNITIDSQCKDLSRSMLLSYDPDIYCNPHSLVFEEVYSLVQYSSSTRKGTYKVAEGRPKYSDDPKNVIESILTQLENREIDITSSYSNWIKIGYALCTTFGEGGRDYYHRIGKMYPQYTQEETDKKYSQLLSNNNGMTRLGSIVYLAREAGVKLNKK